MCAGLCLLAALLIAAGPAAAQDDTLQSDVSVVFGDDLSEAVAARLFRQDPATCRGGMQMITVPAFSPERSAGICRRLDGFIAYAAVSHRNLAYAGYDSTGVDDSWSLTRAQSVGVDRAEARIDSALAARVVTVWARALRTTRQPPDPDPAESGTVGTDGETVYFASFAPTMLTAHASDPSTDSLPYAMAELGDAIRAVALRRAPAGTIGRACGRVETFLAAAPNP